MLSQMGQGYEFADEVTPRKDMSANGLDNNTRPMTAIWKSKTFRSPRENANSCPGDREGLHRSNSYLGVPGLSTGRSRGLDMVRPQFSGRYSPLYSRQLETDTTLGSSAEGYGDTLLEGGQDSEPFPTGDLNKTASLSSPVESKNNNAYEQAQLLLVSLLENFCALYDRNPDKNRRLFIALCKQLWNMGILTSADFFNRSETLRGVYKEAFRTLVLQAIQGIEADTEGELRLLPSQGEGCTESEESAGASSMALSRSETVSSSYGSAFEVKPVQSRLESEFKDLEVIGRGGFAQVLRGEHRIDHCLYAFKRIEFKSKDSESYEKIIREIKSLAHLDHPYIVRYHGAWVEPKTQAGDNNRRKFGVLQSRGSPSTILDESLLSGSSSGITVPIGNSATEFEMETSLGYFMIIQMELCQFTLSDWIEQRNFLIKYGKPWRSEYSHHKHFPVRMMIPSDRMGILTGDQKWDINPVENCRIFKCIVKAIQHIHVKGIIHRDLKPGNILFQVDGDVYIPKIGDFGLASDLSPGSVDSPPGFYQVAGSLYDGNNRRYPPDIQRPSGPFPVSPSSTSRSARTTGLGTCMYAAPEQIRDSNYDEKVDIYSLGIILFELFHPFATRMERQDILEDLKNGMLPASFVKRWPKEATIVWSCISQNAETRPTAQQILESEILEQDPDDIIERLIKENSTLKMLLELERDRARALEQKLLSLTGKVSGSAANLLADEFLHMDIRQA